MKRSTEELALILLPIVTVIAGEVILLSWEAGRGSRDALFLFGLVAIPLLMALLLGGFRYYRARPFVGLLTAFSLLLLVPHSQSGTANDLWQLVLGVSSGIGGGCLTLVFLVLSLGEMRRGLGGTPAEGDVRDSAPRGPTGRSESFTSAHAWGIQQDRPV